jgi:hypothetical protein
MQIESYKNIANPYYKLFFIELTTDAERNHFLFSFQDSVLVDRLRQLVDLFILYPFRSYEIVEFCRSNFDYKDEEELLANVLVYQQNFYITTYTSAKDFINDKGSFFARLLESRNRSFQVLIEMEADKNFDDYFLEAFGKAIRTADSTLTKSDLLRLKILNSTFDKGIDL